jgi:ABC-2 type transport system ATP-binding protein
MTVINAVETSGLTKKFGSFTAVGGVNINIPQGEIFGLLGPNGAGKTTTIRMLCGLLAPTEGSASVLGLDVEEDAEQIKQNIGYMSQKFSLYNDLTAWENIEFYASIYAVPKAERKKRVEELIEMSGLLGHEKSLTRSLSGAWRQRLALACAIVHRPQMLFLDEATAGVDPVSRREFWDLIYKIAGEGVTILATTHYMDEAEYCNMIGMMHRGELIALESPDTLKDTMPGVLLQVECDRPMEAIDILEGHPDIEEVAIHGVLLHVNLAKSGKEKMVERLLTRADIPVHRVEETFPSLEDVFISMIEEKRRLINGSSPT